MDPADTSAGLATRVTHALKLRRQPTTRYDEATKALTETANEALEAITSQASKAFSLQAYWDQALESAGAATYRGLSQVSEPLAKSFVDFGLWTRGHGLGARGPSPCLCRCCALVACSWLIG